MLERPFNKRHVSGARKPKGVGGRLIRVFPRRPWRRYGGGLAAMLVGMATHSAVFGFGAALLVGAMLGAHHPGPRAPWRRGGFQSSPPRVLWPRGSVARSKCSGSISPDHFPWVSIGPLLPGGPGGALTVNRTVSAFAATTVLCFLQEPHTVQAFARGRTVVSVS